VKGEEVNRRNILVVDDEESIRFTFASFLSDEGYQVETASGYDEGHALINEKRFDLVFIDIILDEGRSGILLLEEVRNRAPETEVIIITGAPTVQTASEALRLGALDYLVKPVRQETLVRATEMALKHKILRQEKESYQQNLEAIFRSVQDAIITVDEDLIVVEANRAAAEICGIDRDHAAGTVLDRLDVKCGRTCLQTLRKTVADGRRIDVAAVECGSPVRPDQVVSVTATPLMRRNRTPSGGVLVIRNETRLVELERSLAECRELRRIVGRSDGIRNVVSMINTLSDVHTSVLISGESGTGKELVADALHAAGNRSGRNLVKINCAALSEGLLESELFGHVRGAFTGAVKDKVGRFQRAHGGTIFLDEIGEMTPQMQLRLLRVLESMEFERVGDSSPIKVDVRVIAATNRDLATSVGRGAFREDLYFRLKVVEIHMPPLRDRRDDIPLLVQHFLQAFNRKFSKNIQGVSEPVAELFGSYHWPGNVRQLENVLEHACVLSRGQVLTEKDLPPDFMPGFGATAPAGAAGDTASVRAIREALKQASFNKSKAARLLGISRRTLYRRLEEHGIRN
jgi:PAS domain S-box-containing protein